MINVRSIYHLLVISGGLLLVVLTLVLRSWSAVQPPPQTPLLTWTDKQNVLPSSRLVEAMDAPNNILTFHQYMDQVYHRRASSSQDIWDSLTEQQRDMLICSDFDPSTQLSSIAEGDYEPGPFEYDTRFKNPCWWEPMSERKPYNPKAYIKPGRMENYLDDMDRHWKKVKGQDLEKRLRCVPYVYVVGTGKCGSTDLYNMLKIHHQIQVGPLKEPRWLIRTRFGNYQSGVKWFPLRTYADIYDGIALHLAQNKSRNNVVVDASVGTMYITDRWMLYPGNEGLSQPRVINAHHLRALVPHAKIVILIREPVERLYSHYKEDWEGKATPEHFHRRVVSAMERMNACLTTRSLRECVYDPCVNKAGRNKRIKLRASIYYLFIKDWLEVFPKEQVLISTLEDYRTSRLQVLDNLTEFLGIENFHRRARDLETRNPIRASSGKPMLAGTQTLLEEFFKPFNIKLKILLSEQSYNLSVPYL